jgi:AraC-like DNA-binding protein
VLNQTVFRSDEVPEGERFERWWYLVRETHAPLDLVSERTDDFRATQRVLHLDHVSVWPTSFQPVQFRRTPRLIRASDPETVHLSLPISGALEARRGDHETVHPPGTLLVSDSSQPIDVWAGRNSWFHYGIGLEIPRSSLLLPRDGLARLTDGPIPARSGYGALLAQTLTQLIADTASYLPSDGPRLGALLAELVASLFTTTLGTRTDQSPEGRRQVLLLRIRSFVQEHLDDPDLGPESVAAAHHISVSYLHRLFQQDGTSVAAWIRSRRLERARRDLADPAQAGTPIHAIATRWGFRSPADFSRAFRTRYRQPPRDYRREAAVAVGP